MGRRSQADRLFVQIREEDSKRTALLSSPSGSLPNHLACTICVVHVSAGAQRERHSLQGSTQPIRWRAITSSQSVLSTSLKHRVAPNGAPQVLGGESPGVIGRSLILQFPLSQGTPSHTPLQLL